MEILFFVTLISVYFLFTIYGPKFENQNIAQSNKQNLVIDRIIIDEFKAKIVRARYDVDCERLKNHDQARDIFLYSK